MSKAKKTGRPDATANATGTRIDTDPPPDVTPAETVLQNVRDSADRPAEAERTSLALALAAIDALTDGDGGGPPSFDAAVARRAIRMAALVNARRSDLAVGEVRELLAVVVHTAGRGATALGLGPEEVEALIEPAGWRDIDAFSL